MSSRLSSVGSPARTSFHEKASVNACLACRKVKMKCHISERNTTCDRCIRKSAHCIFEKHRRGRKPAPRPGQTSLHHATDVMPVQDEMNTPRILEDISNISNASNRVSQGPQERPQSDFWALLEGFRPSGFLNKQVMTGKLSLENITHGHNNADSIQNDDDVNYVPADDPVRLGIVNSTIAASLFASFMRDLNPYVCQFDTTLHTFAYVQRRSSFLLSAILAASAKAFNPSSHRPLRDHAEELFTRCFRSGKKSTEIIQAIMVLTYWKEADDTRAWLSIGYVIRMCMELGWHKLSRKSSKERENLKDVESREVRSIERTWLLLFMYDRSLSLQTGSPSMIPRNELIESAHIWYDDPMSTPQDRMLCALVTLRMIGSEIFDLLNPHRSSSRSTLLDRSEGLMKVLLNDINKWHRYWSSIPEMAGDDLYQFFINFYGTNLRLLFSLFPLHATLTSGLPEELVDKQSLLISYSSAVEMLQLLVQPSFSPCLYLVQDTVHIMIAYAAIFLVKLLLSVPKSIRSELESPAMEAIRKAANMFSHHAAPPSSGCGLQAKFLQNVLRVFRKVQEPRPGRTMQENHPQPLGPRHDVNDGSSSRLHTVEGATEYGNTHTNEVENSTSLPESSNHEGNLSAYDNPFGFQDFAFADDEIWANLFADAGFSINEGVFLPFGDSELGNLGPPT